MTSESRVIVYIACSFDGFIAGPDDDLSWLDEASEKIDPSAPTNALDFGTFISRVGALLMGRSTYDVVAGMGEWFYGDRPVLVATHRPLDPVAPTVLAVQGTIDSMVSRAQEMAGTKDVYVDGGNLIRQTLDAGLVDELVITFVPVVLGSGVRLFDGLLNRATLEFVSHEKYGEMLQVTARVLKL